MRAMRVTEPIRPLGDCANPKPASHLHVLEETVNGESFLRVRLPLILTHSEDVPLWTANPFALESSLAELDDTSVAIVETYQPVVKRPAHPEAAPKPRPSPIYKDKRVEEYWAFLKTVPEIQTDRLPSLSRCPSLMSGVSSRNSSTRSTRSSIWDPAEDCKVDIAGVCRTSDFNDLCIPETSTHAPLVHAAEQSALRCPVKVCSKRFTRPADRKRHVFRHFTGVLRCGFCTTTEVSFSQSSDRVGLFLAHLVKKHGASGQPLNAGAKVGKLNKDLTAHSKSNRRPSFEGPVATCSVCTEPFGAQGYYEHLRGCIFREITRNEETHIETDSHETDHENFGDTLDPLTETTHQSNASFQAGGSHDAFEYTSYLSLPGPSTETPETEYEDMAELTASSRCLSLTSSKAVGSSEEETDWTEEQTSRESSPGISQLPRRLSPAKRRVVETIMQEFQRLFSQGLRSHTTSGDASSSSNGGCSGWSSNASIYSTSSFASRKRSLSGGGSTPPNEDGDSNKRRRPFSKADGKKSVVDLRFACPFHKRNPGRHQTFTSCRDPGFTTVARLKEHLYRRHLLPPQCHRCCTTFTNDVTLREHQRDPRGCDVREQVPLEGFDKEQERRLKSKKKSQVHQTEEEKWKGVYRILFPDDGEADIPTPYIEYQPCTGQTGEPSNVVRFQEFSRLELPRLVRRTLEAVIEQEAQPLEDKMKERLVDIVKECQSQLLSMFQTMSGTRTGMMDSLDSVAPVEPSMTLSTAGVSTQTTYSGACNAFQDFDSMPTSGIVAFRTTQPSEFQMTVTAPKLPASSNSSDSGYDSTWPPTQAAETGANAGDIDFPFPTNPAHHGYVDLSGYFGLYENRTDSSLEFSNSMISADLCKWSFDEQMPNSEDAGNWPL